MVRKLNKRAVTVLSLLGAFLLLLVVYLAIIRPAVIRKEEESSVRYPSYLFESLDVSKLLSVTLHPKEGKEYAVVRYELSQKEIKDADVTAEIELRMQKAGVGVLTDAFMIADAKEWGEDYSTLSGSKLEKQYRAFVKLQLTLQAMNDASWSVELDVDGDGKPTRFSQLEIDPWKLASLRTAARMVVLYNTVATTDPEVGALKTVDAAEFERLKTAYGLTGDAYVVVKDADGNEKKILLGNKDTTGQGYFVMLEGGDRIGTTNTTTLGDFLNAPAAELVLCQLITEADNQYAYAYVKNLTTKHTSRVYAGDRNAASVRLEAGDTVGLTYTLIATNSQGETVEEKGLKLYSVPLVQDDMLMPKEALDVLVGLPLGDCDVSYPVRIKSEDGTKDTTVTLRVTSVDYVEETVHQMTVSHLLGGNGTQAPVNIYGFSGPDKMLNFLPNNNNIMTAMENINKMTGTVVELGLTEEVFEKYGLWRHTVSMEIPYYNGKDPSEHQAAYYIEHVLYVSDRQPDGTYFVASTTFNIVAKVEAKMAEFVENTDFDWVDTDIVTMKVDDLAVINFVWNFGEGLKGTFRVEPIYETREKKGGGTETYMARVAITLPGQSEPTFFLESNYDPDDDVETRKKKDETAIFRNLAEQMLYLSYAGDLELSEAQKDALVADKTACALRVVYHFKDGTDPVTLYFYPYTGSRCMVMKDGVASFYAYNTALKTTASNFLKMLKKEAIDPQDRY